MNARQVYLEQARKYARRRFNQLADSIDYRHCHVSHCAAKALADTQAKFTDLCSFGVEGTTSDYGQDEFTLQYLNMGETYEPTICYYKDRFIVASFGDIAEKYL